MPLLELQRTQMAEIKSMGISVASLVPSELTAKKRTGKLLIYYLMYKWHQWTLSNVLSDFSTEIAANPPSVILSPPEEITELVYKPMLKKKTTCLLAIDEVHCLTEWYYKIMHIIHLYIKIIYINIL